MVLSLHHIFIFYFLFQKNMAYQYPKGHKKMGGRAKGTPNKKTTETKECIARMLNDYQTSGLMESDFIKLEPKDRMAIAERFMQYLMPKMQATSMDITPSGLSELDKRIAALGKEEEDPDAAEISEP